MGATGPTPWNVISGMINKRISENREKHNKAEAQERQNEFDIIMDGIRARAASGTLTDEQIEQAKEKMRKLVPKESHPLVDAVTGVFGKIRRKPGQARVQGQGQQAAPAPAPSPQAAPGASAAPSGAQTPPAKPPLPPGMYPTAAEMGTAAGESAAAQEKVAFQTRKSSVDALRNVYAAKGEGKGLSPETSEALDVWAATGHMPSMASMKHKMKALQILDPAGSGYLVPAVQDLETTEIYANGQVVDNPRFMPKWKPHKGWTKDAQGRWMSFNVDPQTNQPIPGTESTSELPPAGYLDKVRTGMYHWTDDSGGVHESPFTTSSFVNIPTPGQGKATPAVPPAMAKLPKTKAAAKAPAEGEAKEKGAGKGAVKGERILGTKDTGVLSPLGQKTMITTEPVANQAKRLVKVIEDAGLQDNNTPGYLLLPYIAYRLGYASEGALESEIAGLSLGSVIEAASALQGTTRAISGLRLAMVHTPNAKFDSPKQIYHKLHVEIVPRLEDIMSAAKKYGRKRATAADTTAVPPDVAAPPPSVDVNRQADEILAK